MTSKLKRAQSKSERSLLIRGFWKTLLGLTVIALMAVSNVNAQIVNNSVLIGQQGINQPRGMIRVTVPNPAGGMVTDY